MGHQIWVGNIPYETTEEELREIMSTVAPVVNIRIRYDKETGQSKGFAFCEYEDAESCVLAVKHLHGTLIGGRPIRLDFCSNDQTKGYLSEPQRSNPPETGFTAQPLSSQLNTDRRRPESETALSRQTPLRVEISHIVESLSAAQLFYILGHMQKLVLRAPDVARCLLRENPSFCYALLHAQFICSMVDEPFTGVDDADLVDQVIDDSRRQQLEEMRYFYNRNAQMLNKRAETIQHRREQEFPDLAQTTQHSFGLPIILAPTINQKNGSETPPALVTQSIVQPTIGSETSFSTEIPQPTPPMSEAQTFPTSSTSNTNEQQRALIDQILAHPDILQQIVSVTPDQEAAWTPQERMEMTTLREGLRSRGVNI